MFKTLIGITDYLNKETNATSRMKTTKSEIKNTLDGSNRSDRRWDSWTHTPTEPTQSAGQRGKINAYEEASVSGGNSKRPYYTYGAGVPLTEEKKNILRNNGQNISKSDANYTHDVQGDQVEETWREPYQDDSTKLLKTWRALQAASKENNMTWTSTKREQSSWKRHKKGDAEAISTKFWKRKPTNLEFCTQRKYLSIVNEQERSFWTYLPPADDHHETQNGRISSGRGNHAGEKHGSNNKEQERFPRSQATHHVRMGCGCFHAMTEQPSWDRIRTEKPPVFTIWLFMDDVRWPHTRV